MQLWAQIWVPPPRGDRQRQLRWKEDGIARTLTDNALARADHTLVRYADDFLVLCRSRAEAEASLVLIRGVLDQLHLKLNDRIPLRLLDQVVVNVYAVVSTAILRHSRDHGAMMVLGNLNIYPGIEWCHMNECTKRPHG